MVEILKEVDHLTEEEVLRINEFISGNKIEFKEKKKTFLRTKIRKLRTFCWQKILETQDC